MTPPTQQKYRVGQRAYVTDAVILANTKILATAHQQFTLFVVGLDFEKVEGLLLAKRACGLVAVQPIANGQRGGGRFGTEDFLMVGDANGDFGLGTGSVNFSE